MNKVWYYCDFIANVEKDSFSCILWDGELKKFLKKPQFWPENEAGQRWRKEGWSGKEGELSLDLEGLGGQKKVEDGCQDGAQGAVRENKQMELWGYSIWSLVLLSINMVAGKPCK